MGRARRKDEYWYVTFSIGMCGLLDFQSGLPYESCSTWFGARQRSRRRGAHCAHNAILCQRPQTRRFDISCVYS